MNGNADLRRAAVFHAVARAGGIAAAARTTGKSAPAVHGDLRRFERDMGVALTERAGRGLRLTPEGRVLFETIGRALDEIERVRAHVRNLGASALPLRIGAVTGFGRYRLMPRLLAAVPADRPIALAMAAHDDLLAMLARGEIDLALTYRSVTTVPIESVPVAREELVLVGSGAAASPGIEALERRAFITYDEHEYVFARWFAQVHGRQPARLVGHDHYAELEEALASVAADRGMTITPADACTPHPALETGPRCTNPIYLCATANRLASADAELVRRCLG